MPDTPTIAIYELTVNVRVSWQAHSLSNAGTEGSNRLMPRRQMLADGSVTDACSGSIAKHHHAVLLAEYLAASGVPLCPACQQRDGRRVAALVERPEYRNISVEQILRGCGLCDAHGFLVTAKNASKEQGTEARQRLTKHSLVEFSFALGLPDRTNETQHLFTRVGDSKKEGQMLMKMPARSGDYALAVRYTSVGVGVDTDRWRVAIEDDGLRLNRHRAVLAALRDTLLSPDGAMTATMLPHLTGLRGAIVVRSAVGRAPLYSALVQDFVERLSAMAGTVYPQVPLPQQETSKALLSNIGYWGQASSFATCLQVNESSPKPTECAQPLQSLGEQSLLRPYFCCVHSEFWDARVAWEEVVPFDGPHTLLGRTPFR